MFSAERQPQYLQALHHLVGQQYGNGTDCNTSIGGLKIEGDILSESGKVADQAVVRRTVERCTFLYDCHIDTLALKKKMAIESKSKCSLTYKLK